MSAPSFAEVAVARPLDQLFTYSIPASLAHRVCPGMRVLVSFGREQITGYVVGLRVDADRDGVKPIIDVLDEGPVFTEEMLGLCKWISEYYCCSWGEALQCGLPSGITVKTKYRYTLVHEAIGSGRFTERQRKVVGVLHARGPLTEGQLAKEVGRAALSNTLRALVRRGILVAESVIVDKGVSMATDTWVCLEESAVADAEALEALQRRAPKQAAVYLDLLYGEAERRAADMRDKHGITRAILNALMEKGLVRLEERELFRRPDFDVGTYGGAKPVLNDEQQRACDAVCEKVNNHTYASFVLQGITGSGKTEVYLQAIEHALSVGRTAIILVPEISLTPQTVGRFLSRFDSRIAVLHSGLSKGERFDEWRRAQRGEVGIVVGARSAIFAPLKNLGVIVVDEEHDASYKQGETPRYHARDVAVMRAIQNNAVCVLGSATPSIEASHNCEREKFTRLSLLRRATEAALPGVKLVDMREEAKDHKGQIILSRTLEEAIQLRVDAKEQVVLLLNRRGHSPYVLCPQCSWVAECTDCQVSMTYHEKGGYLSCHYCNRQRPIPLVCDECHFNPLLYIGLGTQKAEDYLVRAFPSACVARMDADTTAGRGGHAKILGRFASGEIDILLGTQMIAKGHDYPGVTLVGVLNADTGLCHPDFRAAENTFQLLTQVAGRAGRGDKPGEVLFQTYRPKHFAIQAAANHDYASFYAQEIRERESAGYPPFRRMANFVLASEDPHKAERGVARLHRLTREKMEALEFQGMEIIGPAPAIVRRVKKKFLWNMAVLSRSASRINRLVREVRIAFDAEYPARDVTLKADLDPQGSA